MVATIESKKAQYERIKKECEEEDDYTDLNRVTDIEEEIYLYKKAYEMM